jgi:hypothetical protein
MQIRGRWLGKGGEDMVQYCYEARGLTRRIGAGDVVHISDDDGKVLETG